MSIIWCGGEDIDFMGLANVPLASTSSTRYRSDFTRCGLYVGGGALCVSSVAFSSLTDCWLSAQIYTTSSALSTYNSGLVYLSNGVDLLGIEKTLGQCQLVTYDGASKTVLATEVGTSFSTGNVDKVDIHLENYGASSTITVYINGTAVISFSGDCSISGVTGFTGVGIKTNSYGCASEIIVADEDTRTFSLKTLAPDSAGDTNDWDGAYTDIDDVSYDDTDLLYTYTASEDAQLNLTGMPTGDFTVKAVKCIARVSDHASLDIKLGIKTNSVLHLGSTNTTSSSWEMFEELYQTNPETSAAFTPTEIGALQIAFQSV